MACVRRIVLLCAVAVAVALPSTAAAMSFPRTYRGTVTGSQRASGSLGEFHYTWTIRGLVLRRTHTFHGKHGWSAPYKTVAGSVSFHARVTGSCTGKASLRFKLRPDSFIGPTAVGLVVSPSGRSRMHSYFWTIRRGWEIKLRCEETSGLNGMSLPNLFDPGAKRWPPSGPAVGTRMVNLRGADYNRWHWDLQAQG